MGTVPTVTTYTLGQTLEDGDLPPGDSFGVHVTPGVGVHLLAAIHRLRTPELAGFREGPVRFAVGSGPEGLAILAYRFEGFGWCDGAAALHEALPDPLEEYQRLAALWAEGGGHAAVAGVLVDRDAGDAVAALRYFTLSPHVTRTLGRLLVKVYAGPVLTDEDYATRVRGHQAAHPDSGRWVKDHALATCKGGD